MVMSILALAAAATTTHSCLSVAPEDAKLFTYEDFGGGVMRVNSTQCGESYILYPRAETAPDICTDTAYKCFGVPLQEVAVTQTV